MAGQTTAGSGGGSPYPEGLSGSLSGGVPPRPAGPSAFSAWNWLTSGQNAPPRPEQARRVVRRVVRHTVVQPPSVRVYGIVAHRHGSREALPASIRVYRPPVYTAAKDPCAELMALSAFRSAPMLPPLPRQEQEKAQDEAFWKYVGEDRQGGERVDELMYKRMTDKQKTAWTKPSKEGPRWRDYVFIGYEAVWDAKADGFVKTKVYTPPGGGAETMKLAWIQSALRDLDEQEGLKKLIEDKEAEYELQKELWSKLDSYTKFSMWKDQHHLALRFWPDDKKAQDEFCRMMATGPATVVGYVVKEGVVDAVTGGAVAPLLLLRYAKKLRFAAKIRRGAVKPRFPDLSRHAADHAPGMTAQAYYDEALSHMATGTPFRFTHDGQMKVAYITRLGKDSFMFTSTHPTGSMIFTHLREKVNADYLTRRGITLPEGF